MVRELSSIPSSRENPNKIGLLEQKTNLQGWFKKKRVDLEVVIGKIQPSINWVADWKKLQYVI